MRTVARLLFLLIAFMLGYNQAYSQTRADVRLGEIINSGVRKRGRQPKPKTEKQAYSYIIL